MRKKFRLKLTVHSYKQINERTNKQKHRTPKQGLRGWSKKTCSWETEEPRISPDGVGVRGNEEGSKNEIKTRVGRRRGRKGVDESSTGGGGSKRQKQKEETK